MLASVGAESHGGSLVRLWECGDDAASGSLQLYDTEQAVQPHGGARVRGVRLSHNNQVLASCGDDGTVALSLVQNGRSLGQLAATADGDARAAPLRAVAFDAGSKLIAFGGDGAARTIQVSRRAPSARARRGRGGEKGE